MKRPFTISDLKKSACAPLNQALFADLEAAPKQPKGDCPQVTWMWMQLAAWSLATSVPVTREYRFHPERRWRFDFALVDQKIAIEYEGIGSAKSRHTTLTGYTGDAEKYNEAQALGWKVLRFTAKNYKNIITQLKKTIND